MAQVLKHYLLEEMLIFKRECIADAIKIYKNKADRKSNRMRTIMAQVLGITGLQAAPA
jgi:cation transport regulator ChaB